MSSTARYTANVSVSRLASTLVGLANANGGTVLIGVSPRGGEVQGVPDPEEVSGRVFQAALLAEPPLVLPIPKIETREGASVVRVTVPAGLPHVYSFEGRYLIRSGRRETPLSARKLRELLVSRGAIQF
ncbi:MAG TPA: ATP-binding protein, partial [Anaerolineales bacterium]|nr:ATP-binding protein [Anaerolineales bacterium]